MSMRTPYSRVTGLGSAKEGTGHFIKQRVTALANIPLTLFLVWFLITSIGMSRVEIIDMLANPLIAGALILTIISVCWHMRIGVQVVIEDYIHTDLNKTLLLIGNTFFSFGVGALCVVSILKLSFGG